MSGQATSYGFQPTGIEGLTARGSNQATALLLPSQFNIFTSVPPGAGCISPAIPSILTVINFGANNLSWYPPYDDRVSGYSVNQPIQITPGNQLTLVWFGSALYPSSRTWIPVYSPQIGNETPLAGTGLVASGLTQGVATMLYAGTSVFTTVPTGTGAVIPATAPVGSLWDVWNASGNDMLVWPFSGAQIESFGTNNPATVGSGGRATFVVESILQVYAR